MNANLLNAAPDLLLRAKQAHAILCQPAARHALGVLAADLLAARITLAEAIVKAEPDWQPTLGTADQREAA